MSPRQRIPPMNETLTTLVIAADKFTRQTPYHRAASGPGPAPVPSPAGKEIPLMMVFLFLILSVLFTLLLVQAVIDGGHDQPYTAKAILAGVCLAFLVALLYYF